jgi:hypothetical protein
LDTQPRRLRLSVARRTAPDANSYTYAKWDANPDTYSHANGNTYCNTDSYPDTYCYA